MPKLDHNQAFAVAVVLAIADNPAGGRVELMKDAIKRARLRGRWLHDLQLRVRNLPEPSEDCGELAAVNYLQPVAQQISALVAQLHDWQHPANDGGSSPEVDPPDPFDLKAMASHYATLRNVHGIRAGLYETAGAICDALDRDDSEAGASEPDLFVRHYATAGIQLLTHYVPIGSWFLVKCSHCDRLSVRGGRYGLKRENQFCNNQCRSEFHNKQRSREDAKGQKRDERAARKELAEGKARRSS